MDNRQYDTLAARNMRIEALNRSFATLAEGISPEGVYSAIQKATVVGQEVLMLPGAGAEFFGLALVGGLLSYRTSGQGALTKFLLQARQNMFQGLSGLYSEQNIQGGFAYLSSLSWQISNFVEGIHTSSHPITSEMATNLETRISGLAEIRAFFWDPQHAEVSTALTTAGRQRYEDVLQHLSDGSYLRQMLRRQEGLE